MADFERQLPHLRPARNVVSHIDEYLSGEGKNKSVRVGALSVAVLDRNRLVFSDFEFNLDAARSVAEALCPCRRTISAVPEFDIRIWPSITPGKQSRIESGRSQDRMAALRPAVMRGRQLVRRLKACDKLASGQQIR